MHHILIFSGKIFGPGLLLGKRFQSDSRPVAECEELLFSACSSAPCTAFVCFLRDWKAEEEVVVVAAVEELEEEEEVGRLLATRSLAYGRLRSPLSKGKCFQYCLSDFGCRANRKRGV